jgi:hypothetical protein
MKPETAVEVVARLYVAAGGRQATDVDFDVYARALDDLDDDLALEAIDQIVRELVVDRPSPALVRHQAQAILARQSRPAVDCCKCHGEGMVDVGSGVLTVRPCAECRPQQYARWLRGHYENRSSAA